MINYIIENYNVNDLVKYNVHFLKNNINNKSVITTNYLFNTKVYIFLNKKYIMRFFGISISFIVFFKKLLLLFWHILIILVFYYFYYFLYFKRYFVFYKYIIKFYAIDVLFNY